MIVSAQSSFASTRSYNNDFVVAASNGDIKKMETMLDQLDWNQQQKLINSTDITGVSALITAAFNGKIAVVNFLIRKGAQIDAKDSLKNHAFLNAAEMGHSIILKSLFEAASDEQRQTILNAPNFFGDTPLILAASNGHLSVVDWLIERGADITTKDKVGYDLFLAAAASGEISIMEYLLQKYPAMINSTSSNGSTPLIVAAYYGRFEAVQYLTEYVITTAGIDHVSYINAKDNLGANAFLNAAIRWNVDIMEYLLNRDSKLANSKDKNGQTALDFFPEEDREKITNLLNEYCSK